jgi:hypothetical protein
MCLPIDDASMLCWLRSQLKVVEAWRDELASRPDLDLEAISRLEQHYNWLSYELSRLDNPTSRQAT